MHYHLVWKYDGLDIKHVLELAGFFQIQNEHHDYSIESSILLHKRPSHFNGDMAWPNIDNLASYSDFDKIFKC